MFGSCLFPWSKRSQDDRQWIKALSKNQTNDLAAAKKLLEQLLGHFWRNREKAAMRQNEQLLCQWLKQEERPELTVLESLEICLDLLLFHDSEALKWVEREQLYFKCLRRKVDNEKLETILDRYRDDTIKNLVMEIIQLKDAEQEKRWYESYVMKGLDLGTWNDEKHQPQIPYG